MWVRGRESDHEPMTPRPQHPSHELAARRPDDRGATIVEYALLLALIAVVSIGALSFLGRSASESFEDAAGSIGIGDDADPGGGDGPGPGPGGGDGPGPGPGGGDGPGPGGGDGPGPGGPDGPGAPGGDDEGVGGEEIENPEENEPPAASTEFADWSANRSGNSHNWTSNVTLSVAGSDGAPLQGSAQVKVLVTSTGRDRFGRSYTNTEERMVAINNGSGSTSDSLRDGRANRNHPSITSVRYEIVDVTPVAGGTGVGWDGNGASITILAP
jgi:Flp pilus assembly pilin Flp